MSKSALFALNTMDLLDKSRHETHYIMGIMAHAKVSLYFSQLALASQQHQGKELQRVKAVYCALQHQIQTPKQTRLRHTIAKLTHLEKHLPASIK